MGAICLHLFRQVLHLIYLINCFGAFLVQRVYLAQNQLYYAGYSWKKERVDFTFILFQLESCRVGKQAIYIGRQFTKKENNSYGTSPKNLFSKMLWSSSSHLPYGTGLLQFLQLPRYESMNRIPPIVSHGFIFSIMLSYAYLSAILYISFDWIL